MGVSDVGNGRIGGFARRMNHLQAEEPAARFAAHAHPATEREGLLLRRIEVEKAQHQIVAAVVLQLDHELAPWPELDARIGDHALDLADFAVVQRRDRHDPGLVFVAQRQVQGEVDVANQAELFERLVGRRRSARRRSFGARARRSGHGRILPAGSSP